jgi:anti-anti-sigma factor
MQQIGITRTDTDTALVLALSGEIDLATIDTVARELQRAASSVPPPPLVVLDLAGVSFLSVSALRMVHAFAGSCAERGVRTCVVADPDGLILRILDLIPNAFTPRLRIYDSVPQALHAPSR